MDTFLNANTQPRVKFENIREHAGSQHRAWEELSFILAPTLDSLPTDCRLIRRGTPDGGVEFHCRAPTGGGVWAWQAKYLFELSTSTYEQMTKSFKDALANVPNLSRFTFVLPVDRPAGESGTSAMKKWDKKVDEWTNLAADQGVSISFEYHGHSAVLQALLRPEYAGVLRYFFDSAFLTPEALAEQVDRATNNLGDRYLPKTNVETEFSKVIDALCLTPFFKSQVRELAAQAEHALERLIRALSEETNVAAPKAVAAAKEMASTRLRCKELLAIDDGSGLLALRAAAEKGEEAVRADREQVEQIGVKDGGRKVFNLREVVNQAYRALQDLSALLSDSVLQISGDASLLVVGPAGVGKSHSLADVAAARTRIGAPTVLVLGNHLSPNTSLTNELSQFIELGPWRELIDGMQVAAQLSGQGKALIAVDAINEGAGRDLWKERLSGLLSEIAKAPKVALVLSIRDSYEPVVISDAASEVLARVVHRGLAGRESEAIHMYARNAGLSAPHVPSLNPEFSNPLLLRSMCQAAKARGLTTVPDMSMGEDWIFDGLLDAVNDKVCDRNELDLDPADRVVQQGVRAITAAMVDAKSETLLRRVAVDVGNKVHSDKGRESRRIVSVLEREGLLLREPSNDCSEEVVRFTYQRMSDHYRARSILERCDGTAAARAALSDYHASRGWIDNGLLEAFSSMVPVWYGLELIDLVADEPWFDRARYDLGQSLLDSLAWRPPDSIDERTAKLANNLINDEVIGYSQWLSTVLGVACIPNHPLGAEFIHGRLIGGSMLERDKGWTLWVQDIWLEWDNPIARVTDWLSANDDVLTMQARQDSMLLLSWFLSSSSRRLRDLTTKVLVKLTDRSADGLLHVLRRMKYVDDPYIRERLAAVAFGYASRLPRTIHDSDECNVAEAVHVAAVEMSAQAGFPSVLLSHYMRELFRELTIRLPGVDLAPYREPTCPWPLDPPSRADLAVRLGDPNDHRFLGKSPIGYDFRRYTLERGIVENFALPNHGELQKRERRNAQQRRRRTLARIAKAEGMTSQRVEFLLNASRRSLEDIMERPRRLRALLGVTDEFEDDPEVKLTDGERIRAEYPSEIGRITRAEAALRVPKNIGPSLDVVERWLVDRVLNFGWTRDTGGEKYSHIVNRQLGGAEDKVESLGKKYLWIALRELQVILTQFCGITQWLSDEPAAYDSVWQLRDGSDIDPTVALSGDRPPTGSSSARLRHRRRAEELRDAWWLRGFASPLAAQATNDDAWLKSGTDLPQVSQMLAVTDPAGDDWVVLECHVQWEADTDDAVEILWPDRRDMWVRTQSYLTSAESVPDVRAWSRGKDWMGLWMRTPPDHGEGFYRQYPHIEPWASWFRESQRDHTSDWAGENSPPDTERLTVSNGWYQPSHRGFPQCPQALATFGGSGTFEADMSSKDLPSGILPSPTLLQVLGASQTSADRLSTEPALRLGSIEREYSWSNSDGIVMFATGGAEWGAPTALYVRGAILREALERDRLSWWSWLLGEKITWRCGEPTGNRLNMFGAAGVNEHGVEVWSLDSKYYDGPH